MGHRTVKRVPLDFDWPLHKVWQGYINPHWRPCPEEAEDNCHGGYSNAGKWLESIARLIAIIGDEAAVNTPENRKRFEEQGRIYPHPYLKEWPQAPLTQMPRDVVERFREIEDMRERQRAHLDWLRRNPSRPLELDAEILQFVQGLAPKSDFGGFLGGASPYEIEKTLRKAAGIEDKHWGECKVCGGEGTDPACREAYEAWEPTEPPEGPGWQLWETCSEGSPISPVFETAEALADWAVDGATVFASMKTTRDKWLEMILAEGGCDVGSMAVLVPGQGLAVACNLDKAQS